MRGSERVGPDSSSMELGGGMSTEDMSDPVEDSVSSLEKMVSRSEAVFGEAVSSHGGEHPSNLTAIVSSSMIDESMEVVDKSLMDDQLGHVTGVHLYVTF